LVFEGGGKMRFGSKEPRETAIEIAERLVRYPELQAGVEEYLDVVENSDGDVAKADEAEARLVDLMRRMGRDAMQAWAERKNEKVTMEADKRGDWGRKEKKGSTGR
jgi:hypothetical protein